MSDADTYYEKGRSFRKGINGYKKSASKAVYYWQEAAKLGHSQAQFSLGYMFQKGIGIETDYEQALVWYEKAVDQDNTNALLNLGNMHKHGEGTDKNWKLARELYRRASALDQPLAEINLAFMALAGDDVLESEGEAFRHLRKAADMGMKPSDIKKLHSRLAFGIATENLSGTGLSRKKNLKREPSERKGYGHYIHWIAHEGLVDRLPPEVLFPEVLTLKDRNGKTPLHIAAEIKNLNQFPESILTVENLSKRDNSNSRVVDIAYRYGIIEQIPPAIRYFSVDYIHDEMERSIDNGDLSDQSLFRPDNLALQCRNSPSSGSYLHLIIERGLLSEISSQSFQKHLFETRNQQGRTPLHLAGERGELEMIPTEYRADQALLILKDQNMVCGFHYAAGTPKLSGIPIELFSADVLLLSTSAGESVADIIETHGNTHLLPEELQHYSRRKGLALIKDLFEQNYTQTEIEHNTKWTNVISHEEFRKLRNKFVRDWVENHIISKDGEALCLDQEQAEAVAESGKHIQTTARAGSGKTRTLVTRIIFQIKNCKITPRSILALAFNRDAAKEIRERLSEHLTANEMPHVMTFHALAWRIAKPSEKILFDPYGADEKKLLGQTIKKLITRSLRDGNTTAALQNLIRYQWEKSLEAMLSEGFNLPIDEALELKEKIQDKALDGIRVENSHHKWVYNFLLSQGLTPLYRRKAVRYFGGNVYRPPFFLKSDGQGKSLIIEFESSTPVKNTAQDDFYQGARKDDYQILKLCINPDTPRSDLVEQLRLDLARLKIPLNQLSKEELWEVVKDKTIESFTKSVQNFIARCKKELLPPDDLEKAIQKYDDPSDLQKLFWNQALKFYRQYEDELISNNQTDFDSLMLRAVEKISSDHTRFKSNDSFGEIKSLEHILIDEFQDFSHLFNKLRGAILSQAPELQFFCVGDDWQAINRFAGSNIQYIKEFPSTFAPCENIELTTNYRSCETIVEEGNKVMQGHGSASKAHNKVTGEIYQAHVSELGDLNSTEEIIHEKFGILGCHIMRLAQAQGMPLEFLNEPSANSDRNRKIAILSRHSQIATPNGMKDLSWWQKELRKHLPDEARQRLELSTTHGYKGQEADTVILLAPEMYPIIHQDSILNAIFEETLDDIEMDEQRLFYVGVTRAKMKLIYLIQDSDQACQFAPHFPSLQKTPIHSVSPYLLTGDQALITLSNLPSVQNIETEGTKPFKDELSATGFGYKGKQAVNGKKYAWTYHIAEEHVATSKSVLSVLESFPWVRSIEKVNVNVTTETLTYSYELNKGEFTRLDAQLTDDQKEELEDLGETFGPALPPILATLHRDLKQEWPATPFEGLSNSGVIEAQLEVAWPDDKVGLFLPGDDVGIFRKQGWRLIELSPETENKWEELILTVFDKKPSVKITNEGILKLYHFTDHTNIDSIQQHGIYSNKELCSREMQFTPGGNPTSISLDRKHDLDGFVHICLFPHHPMAHQAKERGDIEKAVFLEIDPTVMDLPEVKASLGVSISADAEIIDLESALNQINWDTWRNHWNDKSLTGLEDHEDNLSKFEFLIPRHIATKYFKLP